MGEETVERVPEGATRVLQQYPQSASLCQHHCSLQTPHHLLQLTFTKISTAGVIPGVPWSYWGVGGYAPCYYDSGSSSGGVVRGVVFSAHCPQSLQ